VLKGRVSHWNGKRDVHVARLRLLYNRRRNVRDARALCVSLLLVGASPMMFPGVVEAFYMTTQYSSSTSLSITHGASSHQLQTPSHGLQKSTTVKEDMHVLNSQIMSYILNMLICVGIILLESSLLQCFLFIAVIDLSSTFDSTVISIFNLLFMFLIYF
jgi:hypothetical protein